MSHFRISLGSARPEDASSSALNSEISKLMTEKIAMYKTMNFEALKSLPAETSAEYTIEDKLVLFTFFKAELDTHRLLLVVQTAYRSFNLPNHLSLSFVGKVFVKGIIVDSENNFSEPDDKLLWDYK